MLPDRIRTERLVLRRHRAELAPLVKEAVDASLAHLKASVPWARHAPFPLAAQAKRLAESAAAFDAGIEWGYSIFDAAESRVLGGIGAEPAEKRLVGLVGADTIEMGYWLRAGATGQGFATEASGALVDAIVTHLRPSRIVICHDPANAPSGGVPRRLGFRSLGIVPSTVLPGRQAADGSVRPATHVWVLERDSPP